MSETDDAEADVREIATVCIEVYYITFRRQRQVFTRDIAFPLSRILKRVTKKAVPVYAVWCVTYSESLVDSSTEFTNSGPNALVNPASVHAVFAIAVLQGYI